MKTRFFTLAALALALVACNNDNENLAGAGQRDFGKHSEADSRRRHCLSRKIQPHKLV